MNTLQHNAFPSGRWQTRPSFEDLADQTALLNVSLITQPRNQMKTVEQIRWSKSRTEMQTIAKIAARAVKMAEKAGGEYEHMTAVMDIEACHCNGMPLKLTELLMADDFNFAHDVFGIRRHINRETGQIENCFVPRYAAA